MPWWTYDGGNWVDTRDPQVYDGSAYRKVNEAFVYDGTQWRRYYTRIAQNTLTATPTAWDTVALSWDSAGEGATYVLKQGATTVYSGSGLSATHTLLDPAKSYDYTLTSTMNNATVVSTASATTPAYPAISLSAVAAAWNSINLSWTAKSGSADQYVLNRASTIIYQGADKTSHTDGSRAASTRYDYTLQHRRSGIVLGSATASATTPARPTTQKVVTLSASPSGSYDGGGALRSTAERYSGRYSSTWGRQKSAFYFDIPADARNCLSMDKVEFSISNAHTYNGSGVTQYIAVTHTASSGFGSWPGSTSHTGGRSTAKGGWYGGAEWVSIGGDATSTGTNVANNFRTQGATGICLVAPNDDIGYYSYWNNNARLRLTYTVYS